MYRGDDGQRLADTTGTDAGDDRVLLPPVVVQPPKAALPLDALGIQHPARVELGDLDLLGYDLYRLGYEHEPEQMWRPGDALHLNIYWRVKQMLPDLNMSLRLIDWHGRVQLEKPLPLGGTVAPSSTWLVGEVIRDQHDVLLGSDLPTGVYSVEARLNLGEKTHTLSLGSLHIR